MSLQRRTRSFLSDRASRRRSKKVQNHRLNPFESGHSFRIMSSGIALSAHNMKPQSLLVRSIFSDGSDAFCSGIVDEPSWKIFQPDLLMGMQVLPTTTPCSRAGNVFGQWRMGLYWSNCSQPRITYPECVNSFDRHVCFIIGSFWINGSGK
jgi:hypothetical protein